MTDVKLGPSDLALFQALERRERRLRGRLQFQLRGVAVETEQMMQRLSKKYGVNLYDYEINWATGECRRRLLPNLPQGGSEHVSN